MNLTAKNTFGWGGQIHPGDALENWQHGSIYKMLPAWSSSLGFANTMEPLRQGAIRNFAMHNSPGNLQSQVDMFGRRALARNLAMARAKRLAGMSAGIAPAAIVNDAYNQTAQETGNYDMQVNSPESQAKALETIIGALSQSFNPQMLQALLGLSGSYASGLQTEFQRPKEQGLLGSLAGLASLAIPGSTAPRANPDPYAWLNGFRLAKV